MLCTMLRYTIKTRAFCVSFSTPDSPSSRHHFPDFYSLFDKSFEVFWERYKIWKNLQPLHAFYRSKQVFRIGRGGLIWKTTFCFCHITKQLNQKFYVEVLSNGGTVKYVKAESHQLPRKVVYMLWICTTIKTWWLPDET